MEDDSNIYAKWLSGELNPEEQQALQNSGEEDILRRIVDTTDSWTLPDLKKETFEKIKQRTQQKEAKVVPLYRKPAVLAIAASVALVLGIWLFLPTSKPGQATLYACHAGETREYILNDCTIVKLSGNSSLAFYADKREAELKGEAYFSVRQKGHFQVNFSNGNVQVLGTKFTILSDSGLTSVKCYEGKVSVDLDNKQYLLTKGNGVRQIKGNGAEPYGFSEEPEATATDEVRFRNAPLAEVCSSIALNYAVSFDPGDVDLRRAFTGAYKRNSLDTSLLMVFEPMGIDFKREGNKVKLKNK
jgi:ferric-dicitrate binding protein FerR (iron transport regulator)